MEEQGFFYRDTWAEIDLDRVKANVEGLRNHLPAYVEIIAVVKANAYGHGDVQISNTALSAGATYLAVAFLDEALSLRRKGITAPILVLGASRPQDVRIAANHKITLTVFQSNWLTEAQAVLNETDQLKLHVKLDTGMGRIGIRESDDLEALEKLILDDNRLELEGVFTHFSTADELDTNYFYQQFARFQEMVSLLKEKPKYIHCSNSAASLRFAEANFNAVRMGISMYGLTPSPEIEPELPYPLKEVFSLHSCLIHVKKLHKGDKVSYGATYEAKQDEWIGTIPIGYADGWIRKLQGQEVLIDGIRMPIVGRICMDQCMILLPHEYPVGTQVTLIGEQVNEVISVNEIAARAETINYEIPCIISNRVPRIYKRNGKTVDVYNAIAD
ncbi:alanine racemase [Bacillus marasmi]|uniref:alanine racemase n=1 Tax=Bacillus marasmi TaxID=1926279 RepID=UPI0011C8D32B|nr:alanine racemase [Bacillus marasmi]